MEQRELPTEEKHDKGFTLVELLIVIVILGILATVTVLAVSGITDEAEGNTCEVTEAALQTAVESYYVTNGASYPAGATISALITNLIGSGDLNANTETNPTMGPAASYAPLTGLVTLDCANA